MRIVIAVAAVLALALAGCGEAKAPEDKPEKEEAAEDKAEEKAEEPVEEVDPMTELVAGHGMAHEARHVQRLRDRGLSVVEIGRASCRERV